MQRPRVSNELLCAPLPSIATTAESTPIPLGPTYCEKYYNSKLNQEGPRRIDSISHQKYFCDNWKQEKEIRNTSWTIVSRPQREQGGSKHRTKKIRTGSSAVASQK